jgi:hypothetical protein
MSAVLTALAIAFTLTGFTLAGTAAAAASAPANEIVGRIRFSSG